jgi:hypothetical protein
MPIAINGSGTVTGISVGGLPDGIVDADMLASNAVTAGKLASGVGGKVLQVVYDQKTDTASNDLATATWWSIYNAGLQVSITPSSASNKILLMATVTFSEGSGQIYMLRFEKNGAEITDIIGDAAGSRTRSTSLEDDMASGAGRTTNLIAQVSAGDTNSRIYNIGLKHSSGLTRTFYLNRFYSDADNQGNGRAISTITAVEIAA